MEAMGKVVVGVPEGYNLKGTIKKKKEASRPEGKLIIFLIVKGRTEKNPQNKDKYKGGGILPGKSVGLSSVYNSRGKRNRETTQKTSPIGGGAKGGKGRKGGKGKGEGWREILCS